MRVMSPAHAERLTGELVRGVPRHVLELLAFRGGAREGQIVREAARRLPSRVSMEATADWVKQSLGFLIVRGDVERGPGGIYRCVPAYVVHGFSGPRGPELRLHGDPRPAGELLDALHDLGAVLEPGGGYQANDTDEEPKPDLGALERQLVIGVPDSGSAASVCEAHGYTVVRLESLAEDLPSLDGLVCPSENDLRPAEGLPNGRWEVYDPGGASDDEEDEDSRWSPHENWRTDAYDLVRLEEGTEHLGGVGTRIFYHGGGGRVFQLDRDSTSLWMLYLDRLYGNPRSTLWHNGRLWTPSTMPFETVRWLELLAGRRAKRGGRRLSLPIGESPGREAQTILKRTLGLRALTKLPERRRSSRRRKGEWGR